jgi:putative ATPase
LAEAAVYIATAPKSNAVIKAIDGALSDIEKKNPGDVPPHLRDSHYKGASKLGHGQGYKYPHHFDGSYVEQQYLPDELKGTRYYIPSDSGLEKEIKKRLEKRDNIK